MGEGNRYRSACRGHLLDTAMPFSDAGCPPNHRECQYCRYMWQTDGDTDCHLVWADCLFHLPGNPDDTEAKNLRGIPTTSSV